MPFSLCKIILDTNYTVRMLSLPYGWHALAFRAKLSHPFHTPERGARPIKYRLPAEKKIKGALLVGHSY
jgi:hypothetical protein